MSTNDISHMSFQEKLRIAVEDALPHMPHELQEKFKELLTPKSLAILGTVAAGYGAAQFFGVGEVADVVLLAAGVVSLGKDSITVGKDLAGFIAETQKATTSQQLLNASELLVAGATATAYALGMTFTPIKGERAVEEAVEAERAASASGPLHSLGQFVKDGVSEVREAWHEHHLQPHRSPGEIRREVINKTISELSPSGILGKAAAGVAKTAVVGGVSYVGATLAQHHQQQEPRHDFGYVDENGVQHPIERGFASVGTINLVGDHLYQERRDGSTREFSLRELMENSHSRSALMGAIEHALESGEALTISVGQHGVEGAVAKHQTHVHGR